VNHQPSGGKSWVARIMGPHPKWGFDRKFLNKISYNYSSSGKTGTDYYKISEDGYYEIQEAWKGRTYLKCENNVISVIKITDISF
jgi:hypothetical protein